MRPSSVFAHTEGDRAQAFRCPLVHPQPTAQACDHEQFAKGPGCVKHINIEAGGLMRVLLDRDAAAYTDLDRQRTAAERINAQAKALDIERPKVRNRASVRNLNTLTYRVINVQALQRARALNTRAATPTPMLC